MQHNSMGQMNDYLNQSKRKIRRRRVFSALSAAVVLGVVVNLMEPASTLTREVICGLEEHTHAEACYADGALICGLPEHEHTEDCYALTRSEAELLAETPESTQDELPGELTAEAVDDEVGEAQDVELTDTEEQTSVGNDETDDTFIPDENPDPLEAYIITKAGTVSAGEPIDLELVHFGGMEPVRRALLVWQGEDTLIDEANAEETVAITPETDETVQIALVAIDANGESATAEWTIPGAELEKQTEVDKTADEEQTEVENDDPEEQAGVEYENAIESDTEEDVTEKSDREEAVDVETENVDVADEMEAAPEAEEAIEETVEETAEEEDTEEGNTEEEIGEEADTDEEVNEAETDAEADVEDVEEEKEAGEEEPASVLLTFEGEDFTVTLKWSEAFSEDAALLVREIDADSEDYAASLAAAEAALNPSKAEEEAPAEEIVEEIESTGNIEEVETPDEASGDESAEQETGKEEAGEGTGETVKLNARFFTVAVAQGDEISVPAGGEITVVSTNEGAMLVRIVDGAAHTGDGIFADYQGEALGIVTVEAMETSAEPEPAAEEPAAEEPAKEPGEEPLEEPADEAAEPDCEAGALVATGEGYTVTMTYEADAQIPADAALAVREIPFGTPEYAEYFNQAGDALSENWDEATALPRFFDITILCNEEEIQPAAPVSVQIALDEAVSVSSDDEMRAIHFAEDAAQVLEAVSEQSAAEGPLPEAAEAVSFDAESFSVYGIVPTATITKKVITADGETFEIHVTYGKEAAIPEGARLTAEEITAESDPETYNTYTALSARAVTGDADAALKLARLFDIAIVDAEGAKIEPGDTVSVEIRMANAQDDEAAFDESGELAVSVVDAPVSEQDDVDFGADDLPAETEPQPIQVVHFINGDEAQVITPEASADAETGADVVSFETESFSIYSVVQLENINAQTDPYGLDGKSFAIVTNFIANNYNYVAVTADALANNPDRLAGRYMTSVNDNTYSNADANVTRWTFDYQRNGQYYIYTTVNGQMKYLRIDVGDDGSNTYLSDEPQALTVENNNTTYLITNGTNDLNLIGDTYVNGFGGSIHSNYGQSWGNSYLRLCTYVPGGNGLNLDGAEFAIISTNRQVALTANGNNAGTSDPVIVDFDNRTYSSNAGVTMWKFTHVNGGYRISAQVGGAAKYLKLNGNNAAMTLVNEDQADIFQITQQANGCVTIGTHDNLYLSQYYGEVILSQNNHELKVAENIFDGDSCNSFVLCTPTSLQEAAIFNPFGWDYANETVPALDNTTNTQGQRIGAGINGNKNDTHLNGRVEDLVYVWLEDGAVKYLYSQDVVDLFTILPVGDGQYILGVVDGEYGRYLKITENSARLDSYQGNIDDYKVDIAYDAGADRYTISRTIGGTPYYLTLTNHSNRDNLQFGAVAQKYTGDDARWQQFVFAEKGTIPVTREDAEKITVQGLRGVDQSSSVIIYYRTGTEGNYQYYAIDHDGKAVPVIDSGDTITFSESVKDSISWKVTPGLVEDTTQYRYMFSDGTNYLLPTGTGLFTGEPYGVMLPGDSSATSYSSTIENWDNAAYQNYGITLDTETGMFQSVTDLEDGAFFFAVTPIPQNEEDRTLHRVDTVDSAANGITIHMFDYRGLPDE